MATSSDDLDINNSPIYFEPPHSISPLPHTIRYGLIGVGLCGVASFLSTFTLFTFLLYRLFTWRAHYKTFLGYNQYVVLFLNLIFADLCQATAFLISFYWIAKDAILAPTPACTAQGFLLHFGDVASAFFVLSIAVHTFFTAAQGIRVAYSVFTLVISLIWLVSLFLTVLGLAVHRETYFVRAGAWCWVSNDYEPERLGLHYFWLFFAEGGLIFTYMVTFIKLRRKTTQLFADQRRASNELANKNTVEAVNRITKLMMLYPFVYVLLTLPVSICRMWSMAHDGQPVSDVTQCIVGALLASCGWVDCLLYSLTRKRLMRETMGGTNCSRNRSHDERDPKGLKSILQTTTFSVRNDSFDASRGRQMPPPLVYSEITSGSGKQARIKSKWAPDNTIFERSPSPQRFADAGFAQQEDGTGPIREESHKQVRRVRAVELQPMPPSKGESFELTR